MPASLAVQLIALESPISVRKQLTDLSSGWLLDHYVFGPENDALGYLFHHDTIAKLRSVSPVLLYGEKAVGKTALAITLAVRWSQLLHERPVCFMTGANFCKLYAEAVEIDDISSFRSKLRSAKLLLIDNIEPLSAKLPAQQELASIIDTLVELQRPVILTSSCLPLATGGYLPHLSSRFLAGFSIQLVKPCHAARSALIEQFVSKINPKLPLSDLTRLADDLSSEQPLSASQLSSFILLANQNIRTDCSIDLFVLRSLMLQFLSDNSPDLPAIAKSVCRRCSVRLALLRSEDRSANIVRARGLAMFLARRFTTLSLQTIGLYFGGRDHSTVLHSIRKTNQLLIDDFDLANCHRDVVADLLRR